MSNTLIAYVDETGDTGAPALGGASSCYGLGCLLIEAGSWSTAFDTLLDLRRTLRRDYGIPLRAEIKANYLIRRSGDLKRTDLAPGERKMIYRAHLKTIHPMGGRAFAVVIDKECTGVTGRACFSMASETLLNRLERITAYEQAEIVVVHDEGEDASVRRLVRKARRYLTAGSITGQGSLQFAADKIIDDPVPRSSRNSYFIQMADLVAYAGWRSYRPPSPGVAQVVPATTWRLIGEAIHRPVNKWSGGEPGVVVRRK